MIFKNILIFIIIILSLNYIISNVSMKEPFICDSKQKFKIYIINLDINNDRLSYQHKHSKKHNYQFTRFKAYNGRKLNKQKLIMSNILDNNNILRYGQLGCALSHIKLLDTINKKTDEYSLILEDDVIIPDNFINKVNIILDNLPDIWDIVFIGGCNIKGKKYNDYFIIPTHYNSNQGKRWPPFSSLTSSGSS